MNNNYKKMGIWSTIQFVLCTAGLLTKGIVDVIFSILWLIAVTITIVYMVRCVKELKAIEKPKTLTQLDKETIINLCLTLMRVDCEKTKMIDQLETKIYSAISLIKHQPITYSRDLLNILEREVNEPR